MTQDEFDVVIAGLIIPQKKPKSTGNSHRRKQWENQKYWRLCTIGETCKLGSPRDYEELCKFYDKFPHWISCSAGWCCGLSYLNYDEDKHHFTWYSYHSKYHRKTAARHVRRYKDDIANGSMYKKIYDYYQCCI